MKVKPKKLLCSLPIYVLFDEADDIAKFAANINTILHGKQRLKYEEMGIHAGQFIGLFYIDRTPEYQELRDFVLEYLVDPIAHDVGPEPEEETQTEFCDEMKELYLLEEDE